jgi:ParB-like chromosome segregation protein Spo0J
MTKANKHQAPQIVARPIEALIPYARNARTHSDEQVALIAASLREFGWTNPVLVDAEGGIIAGHGHVMAARKLAASGAQIPNWPDAAQVPTIALEHLTKAQHRAYVLADNQLATRSGWDAEILAVELDELRDEGFDLDLIGFERAELNDLIGTAGIVPLPDLSSDDREPFQQMTFTVHDSQKAIIDGALQAAKRAGGFDDSPNENSNGNALTRICEAYVGEHA